MSGNDDFDKLVGGLGGNNEDGPLYHTLWEALAANYNSVHEGVLVQGLVIVEVAMPNGDRVLRFVPSPEMTPWTARGMLNSVQSDYSANDVVEMFMAYHQQNDEDDE